MNSEILEKELFYSWDKYVKFKYNVPGIYTKELNLFWNKVKKVSKEFIDKEKEKILKEMIREVFNFFIDTELFLYKEWIFKILEEEARKTWTDINILLKDKFFKYLFSAKSVLKDFVISSFFNKNYFVLQDSILYEDQIYLDIFSIHYSCKFTTFDLKELRNILIDWLKEKKYEWFVLKIDY